MKARAMQANRITKRASGCDGKHAFSSFSLAKKMASRQAHRHGEAFNAYRCDECGKFHVGTAIGGSRERGRAPDPRKPYIVYARDRTGTVCLIGRSATSDGGKLKDVLALDGWEITKVTRVNK